MIFENGLSRRALLITLHTGSRTDVTFVFGILRISIGAQRQRQAVADTVLEIGLVGFETIPGSRGVSPHQPPIAVHVAIAHEIHAPVLRFPYHAQGLETTAATELAIATGIGLDVAAQV